MSYYRLCGALHQSTYRGVRFISKCGRYEGHPGNHFDTKRKFGWPTGDTRDTSEDA